MLRGGMAENNLVAAFTPTIAHALHHYMDALFEFAPLFQIALDLLRRHHQKTGIAAGRKKSIRQRLRIYQRDILRQ